ncbi:MAG: hypothetical protein Q8922_09765 [Bacteroidota bacterium]|nr:hypothetical protein [Bacteroidota bacterium]MDP4232841.1 hypothetical protein [Bacteroidota bacterium]MDP4241885.1 hypothetical protein [Bacteroidota bacterium]MDP4288210.1 hypothetical protein [Bacteroidota bacterium]
MSSPLWWKQFYAAERTSLGKKYLESLILDAPLLTLPARGALIFPHTRLAVSGYHTAAVARAVIESGCDIILALGVLHGVPRNPELRGIHGPGMPNDMAIWSEEFSLDNFEVMLETAARILSKPMPRLIMRYPLLTGSEPASLPRYDELLREVANGAALVATADMIHHGVGYDTPVENQLAIGEEALDMADRMIRQMLADLGVHDYTGFLRHSEQARSDFRDGGPVVAELLGRKSLKSELHDLMLVDYSEALGSPAPMWVAAALASMTNDE